jgi:hypothetical protein
MGLRIEKARQREPAGLFAVSAGEHNPLGTRCVSIRPSFKPNKNGVSGSPWIVASPVDIPANEVLCRAACAEGNSSQ